MKFDVIGAVEACYAPATDDHAWFSGLLETLSPLDHGLGFIAWTMRPGRGEVPVIECQAASRNVGARRVELEAILDHFYELVPPELARRHLAPSPPVGYALRRAVRLGTHELLRSFLRGFGIEDGLGIFASEPGGTTLLLAHITPVGHPLLSARTLHQLALLAAHLNSAARLRDALSRASSDTPQDVATEAVLDPSGRVVDAFGAAQPRPARQRLADAVRRMDRARGALRRTDPEEALGLWQGLVDGTWSLVDHCESDGTRYVLARRNEPGVRDPKALTPRERSVSAFAAMGHQDKFIGYLLGISAGTVSEHLKCARRKLGLSSRAELVRMFARLAHATGTAATPAVPDRRAMVTSPPAGACGSARSGRPAFPG